MTNQPPGDADTSNLEAYSWVVWAVELLDHQRLAGSNVAQRTAAGARAAAELYGCVYDYCLDEDTLDDGTPCYKWYIEVKQSEHRQRVGNVPVVVAELLTALVGSLPPEVDFDQNWLAGPDLYATQLRNTRSTNGND